MKDPVGRISVHYLAGYGNYIMRRFIPVFIAFIILCGSALAASVEEQNKYTADISEGISLLRSGSQDEIHRSIAKFKSALKLRPESAEAYYWLALAYSDLHNYLRAADNAKDATTYNDRLPEAWLLWGQILLYQKEWNEALNKLETAARLAPDNPVVQYNLGRVYYHGFKDPDTALAKFRAAWLEGQKLRRENPEMIVMAIRARLYMGCCEYDRGLRQNNPNYINNAIAAFRDVLQEQPQNYDAQFRLALAMRKAGRSGDAGQLLSNLLQEVQDLGRPADRQFLAEIHLQLADLYIKDPTLRNRMLALAHLGGFIDLIGDSNHPALGPARDYLALHNEPSPQQRR